MPELPEVSVVVKYLNENIVNQVVTNVVVKKHKILKNFDEEMFNQILKNQRVKQIRRRGKYILLDFDKNTLVIHLRMEGKLIFYKLTDFVEQKHDCVYIYFDQNILVYNDVRVFGTFEMTTLGQEETLKSIAKLGLEYDSLELTSHYLYEKLKNKTQAIKTQLLSQSIFVGLGNIYVDEVLLISKVHPQTMSKCITKKQCQKIITSSQTVMNKSIECGGTTVKSYSSGKNRQGTYQRFLLAYGRTNLECLQCKKANITKIKVNGRGTHFCPNCQKRITC